MQALASALLLCVCLVAPSALGWSGRVVRVVDGDTLVVLHAGRLERVRLYGVDAPERRQPFGDKARRFLILRAGGSEVEVDPIGTDRYARTVALVYPRGAQISLNELLVREGLAWVYPRYCRLPACSRWRQLQRRARQARLGLWSLPVPIAPWRFRRDRRAAVLRPPPARQRPWGGLVYHGNPKTRVFHAPGCRFYNCKGCVVIFRSRQEALRAGYRPCRICNP